MLNIAPEGLQGGLQSFPGDVCRGGGEHIAGHILGVGHHPQLQPGDVFLLPLGGKFHCPGGPAHEHGQHAGGHGVQGTGVADPLLVEDAPQLGHHIVAGPVLGLIDDEDSVSHAAPA